MVLTLLRHAPLPLAFHGRYIGHSDIPIDRELFHPLTLPSAYDVIYSSDLIRCTQTLEQLGYNDFKTDERLREVRFKEQFEGKNFDEIEQMEEYDPSFLESEERWYDFVCDEPIEAFRERISLFLAELPRDGKILLCTHGGTIREILSRWQSNPRRIDYLEYTIVTVK